MSAPIVAGLAPNPWAMLGVWLVGGTLPLDAGQADRIAADHAGMAGEVFPGDRAMLAAKADELEAIHEETRAVAARLDYR